MTSHFFSEAGNCTSRSPARAALVMALPRIMPAMGMTYCGWYHGRTRTTMVITYASVAAVDTESATAAIW